MKVLVTNGSKYGSTREVARVIAEELTSLGIDVDSADACEVAGVHFYDAIIIGSAVYGGLWRRDAAGLVREHAEELRHRDVWMFSVGMATVKQPHQEFNEARDLAQLVGAREHRTFDGALDYERLNAGEKAIIRALNPPKGDFRDFAEIRDWAHGVAIELRAVAAL
ncbi:flavodoxin domain-containing protein [Demequina sp. NBRC 110057]|uniref:flavodoxin domain-containing protein n=1 Tax=Demequina sp. NBRC 110057 TaxID=1570346 RepID=UPI000A041ED8|nr:flavodoxin domain-containing protein [Demequina sp. NBRC 110057]